MFLSCGHLDLWVLEVCAHDAMSERSIQDETLEGTLLGTPQARKVILSGTAFARFHHRVRRSLKLTREVSSGTHHL